MTSAEPLPLLREQLVRLAQHRTGDPQAAQDVAQETLARLLESRQTFTSAAHLTGWAVTTTKNLCADHHRQQRRLAVRPLDDESAAWPPVEAADAFTLSRDLVESLLEALATMPDRQAAVLLTAARLGSADRTALAAATGETESAVRNYLHRGRAALRSKLAAAGQGALGLHALRGFLRSAAHRRALTAALLLPVLSLMTVLWRLPLHEHGAPMRFPPYGSDHLETAVHLVLPLQWALPGQTTPGAPAATRPQRPGAPWSTGPDHPAAPTNGDLPVQFMTRGGYVCGVSAGGGSAQAGSSDCGFDLSHETYVGVSVSGHDLGVYEPYVRCTPLPSVPGVVCVDPSPSPRPAPRR